MEFANSPGADDGYLYHATYRQYMKKIKKEGLHGGNPRKNYEDSEQGKVYFATSPQVAESYAESSDSVPEHYLDEICVLKVHKKHLDISKVSDDPNVRNDDRCTVVYDGRIAPEHIEHYVESAMNETDGCGFKI